MYQQYKLIVCKANSNLYNFGFVKDKKKHVLLSCCSTENPVKRKRGRPKGSTKKTRTDVTEAKADSACSQVVKGQREEEKNKEEVDLKGTLLGGGIP